MTEQNEKQSLVGEEYEVEVGPVAQTAVLPRAPAERLGACLPRAGVISTRADAGRAFQNRKAGHVTAPDRAAIAQLAAAIVAPAEQRTIPLQRTAQNILGLTSSTIG